MAAFNNRCLALVALVIGIILISGNPVSSQNCEVDIHGLIAVCSQYILKPGPIIKPSQACCEVLKKVDAPCICKYVTKEVEKLVSMEKVVYVARYCGITVPHGMKCGSYTVP